MRAHLKETSHSSGFLPTKQDSINSSLFLTFPTFSSLPSVSSIIPLSLPTAWINCRNKRKEKKVLDFLLPLFSNYSGITQLPQGKPGDHHYITLLSPSLLSPHIAWHPAISLSPGFHKSDTLFMIKFPILTPKIPRFILHLNPGESDTFPGWRVSPQLSSSSILPSSPAEKVSLS